MSVEVEELEWHQRYNLVDEITEDVVHRYLSQVSHWLSFSVIRHIFYEEAEYHIKEEYELEEECFVGIIPAKHQVVEVYVAGCQTAQRDEHLLDFIEFIVVSNNTLVDALGDEVVLLVVWTLLL